MASFVGFAVYTIQVVVSSLAADPPADCTLGWRDASLGFPCAYIAPITIATVAVAVLGVVAVWSVKRALGSVTTVTVRFQRGGR